MTIYNILPALAGLLALLFSFLLHLAARKVSPSEHSARTLRDSLDWNPGFLVLLSVISLGLYLWFSAWTVVTFLLGVAMTLAAGAVARRVLDQAVRQTAGGATRKAESVFLLSLWHAASVGLAVGGLGLVGVSFLQLLFLRGRIEVHEIVGFAVGVSVVALLGQLRVLQGSEAAARWPGEVGMLQSKLENLVIAVIAAVAIAATGTSTVVNITAGNRLGYMSFPIFVIALGLLASAIGLFLVRLLLQQGPATAIRLGTYLTAVVLLATGYAAVNAMELEIGIFPAMLLGVVSGVVIALVAEWYVCGVPAARIAVASRRGPVGNLVSGLAVAFQSSAFPVLTVCGAVLIAHNYAGLYGIGISAAGMVATLGISASFAAFAPMVAASRNGAEAAPERPLGPAISLTQRAIAESTGNGAALLASLALLAAYSRSSGLAGLDLLEPTVMVGLLAGGILPFCAVSLALTTKEETGGEHASSRSLLVRTAQLLLPLGSPLFVGFVLGSEALGGMLAGSIAAGVLLALTLSGAGQLWQQVKSQAGGEEGLFGVGNELGILFQRDAGPAVTAALKSNAVVALIIAPLLG
jgi:K(+)-stimulated pyrophosphate-energized sodium pump